VEALEAARDILLTLGPQAVTLKAVGAALGMTHANLIHHFGSANGLQTALMAKMIHDLSGTLDGVVEKLRTGELPLFGLLTRVFDIYQASGGGQLTAWLALNRVTEGLEPIADSLNELVRVFADQAGRIEPPDGPIGQAVLLACFVAVAESLAGEQLEAMLGFQPGAARQIAARAIAGIIWGPVGPTGTLP
jgi:AcrR family transcriptional regulator